MYYMYNVSLPNWLLKLLCAFERSVCVIFLSDCFWHQKKENKLDRVGFRLQIKAKEMKIIQCKMLGLYVINQIHLWWVVTVSLYCQEEWLMKGIN